MVKFFKSLVLVIAFVVLGVSTLLHQDLPDDRWVNFSVFQSLENDIDCQVFLTPSFVVDSLKGVM